MEDYWVTLGEPRGRTRPMSDERVQMTSEKGSFGLTSYITVHTEGWAQLTEAADVLALAAKLQALGSEMLQNAMLRAGRKP